MNIKLRQMRWDGGDYGNVAICNEHKAKADEVGW